MQLNEATDFQFKVTMRHQSTDAHCVIPLLQTSGVFTIIGMCNSSSPRSGIGHWCQHILNSCSTGIESIANRSLKSGGRTAAPSIKNSSVSQKLPRHQFTSVNKSICNEYNWVFRYVQPKHTHVRYSFRKDYLSADEHIQSTKSHAYNEKFGISHAWTKKCIPFMIIAYWKSYYFI